MTNDFRLTLQSAFVATRTMHIALRALCVLASIAMKLNLRSRSFVVAELEQ